MDQAEKENHSVTEFWFLLNSPADRVQQNVERGSRGELQQSNELGKQRNIIDKSKSVNEPVPAAASFMALTTVRPNAQSMPVLNRSEASTQP